MQVRYSYRAYPQGREAQRLARLFGCCRHVHNAVIGEREHARRKGLPFPTTGELSRRLLTDAKRQPGTAWLGEVSAVALQQALADADRAYRNFFDSLTGKRRGRRVGAPRFRSRWDHRRSARFTRNARFKIEVAGDDPRGARLYLPQVGWVPFTLSRPLPSDPSSVTIIREPDGRHRVSFVVEVVDTPGLTTGRVCGIDPGLSSFATILTTSETGQESVEKIPTPMFLRRRERALARSQRALSRKQRGSNNRKKAKRRVAVQHRKVRDARLDHAHKHAARVVANHDLIAVEDLAVAGMTRTKLARSVHDQAMGQYLRLIREKAARQGKTVATVDRFFPSTRRCSCCHELTGPSGRMEMNVRTWTCSDCGTRHDRDQNAARNLLQEGSASQTSLWPSDGRTP